MHKSISLAQYVKKRNGVPLGDSNSMRNMLQRSLGAGTFYLFWRYWNPIWGYYLSRQVMKPLSYALPIWLATILTFSVSGALHDLAVMVVKWQFVFLFTPWFTLMGIIVVLSKQFDWSYAASPWGVRMLFNVAFIGGSLMLVRWGQSLIG
ncbi:acyltransferase [Shewanella colwelliana]|uniref:acyltransferase n=1 Tax=Shewanella colwelliana TaxID=23 RepID=UPI0022B0758B|nr:acyltransferase [Shewanella colwelliana]MCZ4338857.1 acyltransferase [Shewanella colwelliana]